MSEFGDSSNAREQGKYVQRNRTEGYVIQCDGESAIVSALSGPSSAASDDYWAVGQLISIQTGDNRVVGLIRNVLVPGDIWIRGGDNTLHVHVEFLGEVRVQPTGQTTFNGGISQFPTPALLHIASAPPILLRFMHKPVTAAFQSVLSRRMQPFPPTYRSMTLSPGILLSSAQRASENRAQSCCCYAGSSPKTQSACAHSRSTQ